MPLESYLEYMRERLYIIKKLLSECGTLYLHIDIKVGHYIRIILDEIFGKESFLNEISRVKSNPKNFSRRAYGNIKDIIYVYAKNTKKNIFNEVKKINEDEIFKKFRKIDTQGRRYTTVPCHAPGETKSGATGEKWRGMLPPKGRHWRVNPDQLDELDKQGLIEWSKNGNPRIIKYSDEYKGDKIQDIWLDYKDPPYPKYPTQKNISMLELIIKQSSNEDSIIMDCFCGSGGFLEAGLKNNRRVIGIDESKIAINVSSKIFLQKNEALF